jgi:hypothetical protein
MLDIYEIYDIIFGCHPANYYSTFYAYRYATPLIKPRNIPRCLFRVEGALVIFFAFKEDVF